MRRFEGTGAPTGGGDIGARLMSPVCPFVQRPLLLPVYPVLKISGRKYSLVSRLPITIAERVDARTPDIVSEGTVM